MTTSQYRPTPYELLSLLRDRADAGLPVAFAAMIDALRDLQDKNGEGSDAAAVSTTALADLERMTILRVFEKAGGDKALTGRMLGISRATLYRKLKQYNIPLRHSDKRHDIQIAS